MAPVTQYADSGGASIAYQVIGDGPLDLLFLPGWISQVEQIWELPSLRRFFERLAAIGRVIQFDRRGTGLSDRVVGAHSLDQEVLDALAVLDAAGSERAALFTYLLGGLVGTMLAADHPQRIGALVMYASLARTAWAPDYDWALTVEQREELVTRNVVAWGEPSNEAVATLAPSMADDPTLANWLARVQRLAASPGEARQLLASAIDLDVRDALPRISVPTLVMVRTGDRSWDIRHSRYLADHIPGARYVEMEGIDSFPFIGDSDAILEEVEEFLTGARQHEVTRALRTVLFSDIVDSTARVAELGDAHWRDLLARHHDDLRKELARFGGHEVKTVGDGVLATFDGPPSSALRCALAISAAAQELGVQVRVGMHTGEVELTGDDVAGMAVHIAARVAGLASAGEVLVSGTVFGTVVGGPFSFEDRGLHELKGVPGRWPLFALGAGASVGG
jgi:class 3 adenylate cyclase/pimeloyl-ACP methyl ester carboxylesterase